MSQGTAVAATTDVRRLLRSVRPLLMLGGFVALWWCLATGTASASDGSDHGLGATTKALGSTAERAVHQTTRRVADRPRHVSKPVEVVRQAPVVAKVKPTIRESVVAPTVKPVVTTVVKPVLEVTTETVRLQTTAVLDEIGKTVSASPLAPVLAPPVADVTGSLDHLSGITESSTLQGETASRSSIADGLSSTTRAVTEQLAAAAMTLGDISVDLHRAAPASPVEQPRDDRGFQSTGGSGASSAQSGSGAGPGAVVGESGTAFTASGTKTSITTPVGRPSAGPAYPPSSSPD